MSYTLTGESNPHFPLRALILAPAIQSQILLKIAPGGGVEKVLRYVGTTHVDSTETVAPGDQTTQRFQVARFELIEDSLESTFEVGKTIDIDITEESLENELFAFIPRVIKQDISEAQ